MPSCYCGCLVQFSFISLFIAFIFSCILRPYSTNSVSILITSVLNCASDRLAISSSLSSIFGALICSFGPYFLSPQACYVVRVELRYSPGQGDPHCCGVTLYVGRGPSKGFLCSLLVFSHFPCYPQSNWPILMLIPRWVGLCTSRTPWVPPTDSPVRLGVAPATATPTDFCSLRF